MDDASVSCCLPVATLFTLRADALTRYPLGLFPEFLMPREQPVLQCAQRLVGSESQHADDDDAAEHLVDPKSLLRRQYHKAQSGGATDHFCGDDYDETDAPCDANTGENLR